MFRNPLKFFSRKRKAVTKIQQTLLTIKEIKVENFSRVHRNSFSFITIQVLFPDIAQYSKKLARARELLSGTSLIYGFDFNPNPSEVFLQKFLLSDKGHYVDPVESANVFLQNINALLILYEEKENEINKSDVLERNLSILNRLILHCQQTVKELHVICNDVLI